jgi:hypothetical protein
MENIMKRRSFLAALGLAPFAGILGFKALETAMPGPEKKQVGLIKSSDGRFRIDLSVGAITIAQ